jgi:rhodanese-related sulfurtransferase
MNTTAKISKTSTMQEVLDAYPSAQRALFQRYHIGGCHSCGYEPTDILEVVASKHNITDMDEVLNFIVEAEEADQRVQISPADLAKALKSDNPPRLVDVRTSSEWEIAHIAGAELINETLSHEIMTSSKETAFVFYCHTGKRSLDAASYFAGHGYTNVKSLNGGIDAWSTLIDPSIPRYEIARDLSSGRGVIRPLRSVVSEVQGCVSK